VEYEVSFCGFAPGFAYLVGLPHQLHLPRRASPRTRVPAGSVAIAATYSAVYPRESPGGWHLLGTTNASMWDVSRQPPALLQPGMGVRFVRVE
jgi:KipI family sensor histidine kinase inhibitor